MEVEGKAHKCGRGLSCTESWEWMDRRGWRGKPMSVEDAWVMMKVSGSTGGKENS